MKTTDMEEGYHFSSIWFPKMLQRLMLRNSVIVWKSQDQEQEDEESQTVISGIRILDNEKLDEDLIELHYKYILKKHYLDENEEIKPYSESRFGFVWIDFKNKYLAMLSKDERVNAVIIERITDLIGGNPLSVVLPKDLVNKFFNFDDLLGASHFNPITGTKHRISGRELTKNPENRDEVRKRDESQIRSGSLYSEPIPGGAISGLGVVSDKGKIYLLKTLSTSALRGWAKKRLPDLVHSLRELQQIGSKERLQTVKSNFHFPGIGQEGKPMALSLMERVLTCHAKGTSSIPLSTPFDQVFSGLSRFFYPDFYPYCNQCANNVEAICPKCGEQVLKPKIQGIVCESCNTTWDYQSPIQVKCSEGHSVSVPTINQFMTLLPKKELVEKIYDELNKIEVVNFDSSTESFYIYGSTFYYFRQDHSIRYKLEELDGFSELPLLPSKESPEYRQLRNELRQLKEVCVSPGVTREMCTACLEQKGTKCCLMKMFHACNSEYLPGPHHGNEFGDVSFPTKLQGREMYFKGLIKSYKAGEVTPRDSLGKDILSQLITQGARDQSENALAVITATRLNPWLETSIEWLVRQFKGRVCIVKEDMLIRILEKYKETYK